VTPQICGSAIKQSEAGRHTPGNFTNQIQRTFEEPRLIVGAIAAKWSLLAQQGTALHQSPPFMVLNS